MGKQHHADMPEALRRLRLFNDKAEKLRRSRFFQMAYGEGTGATLSIGEGQPIKVVKRGADEDATAAFVLTLRFFLQPRDRIQLEQIEQLYRHVPVPDEDSQRVAEGLSVLNAFLDRTTDFAIDGQAITNRMVLETFVYGDHAHANDDKRVEYQKWRSGPFNLILESHFEFVLGHVLRFIFWLERINKTAISNLEIVAGG
jgi:hypothetical protein